MYPATLPNSFIRSSSFSGGAYRVSIYNIMSCANNESFNSSFPVWVPFISSCLSTVARTFSTMVGTMLSQSGESGHPCLILILEEMLLVLPTECEVGCRFFVYGLYYVQVCSLCSHFAESF